MMSTSSNALEYKKFEFPELKPQEHTTPDFVKKEETPEQIEGNQDDLVPTETEEIVIKSETENNSSKQTHEEDTEETPVESTEKNTQDIEKIKQEYYKKGFEAAEIELNPKIQKAIIEQKSIEKFITEIEELHKLKEEFNKSLENELLNIIQIICSKLYLSLPKSFPQMFNENFRGIIAKSSTNPPISIKINPQSKEQLEEIIKQNVPSPLQGDIKIIIDDNLDTLDCQVSIENTLLEYNQKQIWEEIDKIIATDKNNNPELKDGNKSE